MSGLKEKIARATNASSLAWDEADGTERAVDQVTALGLAQVRVVGEGTEARGETREDDRLASCLWRLKYGGDRSNSNFQGVSQGVFARVRGRDNPRRPNWVLGAVVSVAIEEWRVEVCPTCTGRKFVGGIYDLGRRTSDGKARVCLTCNGAGILERSDVQRAEAVMNLLRLTEADRLRRETRVIAMRDFIMVVTPRPEHVPDLARSWSVWGAKYQRALEVVIGLDARLSSRIRSKLREAV